MEIIPVINCHFGDEECVKEKANKAFQFSSWAHLDIADGIFTFNKTWNDPLKWKEINPGLNFEVHLMVENPEEEAENWLEVGAKRIIFHWEAIQKEAHFYKKRDPHYLISHILNLCKNHNAEGVLSICMETKVDEIREFLDNFNRFQILAVYPGPAGQKFLWEAVDKVRFLKELKPEAIVEVDGGINPNVAKILKEVGANILVSGTYIFGSENPKKAFEELVNI